VDVIVGFPGETDEDFLETYHFINNMDVSYLHVFTYSERANTDAAEMKGVVPVNIRRDRNEMLRILSEKKRRNFYEKHLETERPVLFEAKNQEGKMFGFTDNYIKVAVDFDEKLINKISEVRLTTIDYIDEEVVVLSVLR
jgi:threonylcarbamoyladenosine tRNA methylthiotransferase MtaB